MTHIEDSRRNGLCVGGKGVALKLLELLKLGEVGVGSVCELSTNLKQVFMEVVWYGVIDHAFKRI